MAAGRYIHRFDIDDRHSVHIYQGSLVEVEADALVSSDDNFLSAGGGVSRALAQAAGPDVEQERFRASRGNLLHLGDVARTSAGALPCRFLYHAVTIEMWDGGRDLNEATLRQLVINLLRSATEDGVRTLGMPALGTGVAGFDIARASEIIIEELLSRLTETPIQHVVLSLIGEEAEHLFYEKLVRANAPRCAASSLRRVEQQLVAELSAPTSPVETETIAEGTTERSDGQCPQASAGQVELAEGGPSRKELADETGEQFPSLVDEARLATTPADQPKLVAGLAKLLLKHADAEDIEQELLNRPECYGFRGTVEQRLMEFLYLGEKCLRTSLGPALFKAKDLRRIVEELGEDCELARSSEQLIDVILRAMCFNLLAPPAGLTQHIARIERLILDLDVPDITEAKRIATGIEAAKVLEQVLKELLRLYGLYLYGPTFEQEFIRRNMMEPRRDGGAARLTLGQYRNALAQLDALVKKDADLRSRLEKLRSGKRTLLPARFMVEHTGQAANCYEALVGFTHWRNVDLVHADSANPTTLDPRAIRDQLELLRAFLLACRTEGTYPDVLRYEGTFENRNGERFVHFLDEHNTERKVRTDEKIEPRRHYYCFATNNPVHLFPVLVAKL